MACAQLSQGNSTNNARSYRPCLDGSALEHTAAPPGPVHSLMPHEAGSAAHAQPRCSTAQHACKQGSRRCCAGTACSAPADHIRTSEARPCLVRSRHISATCTRCVSPQRPACLSPPHLRPLPLYFKHQDSTPVALPTATATDSTTHLAPVQSHQCAVTAPAPQLCHFKPIRATHAAPTAGARHGA